MAEAQAAIRSRRPPLEPQLAAVLAAWFIPQRDHGPPVQSRWRSNGLLQIPLGRLSDAQGVGEDVPHVVDVHTLLRLVRVEEPEPLLSRVEVQPADRLPVRIV